MSRTALRGRCPPKSWPAYCVKLVFWPAYGVSLTARRKVRALKKKRIGLASLWRFWPLYDVSVNCFLNDNLAR